ncbi:MAG: HAMP domain-containing protein [Desulfobacterales bacterium]|nr:HAMP domain-containing protein [Desulfobacterales bacterium]
MSVICEECGKIYHLDSDEVARNDKGELVQFECTVCGFMITVKDSDKGGNTDVVKEKDDIKQEVKKPKKSTSDTVERSIVSAPVKDVRYVQESPSQFSGIGLRGKMILLFLVVPLTLMAGAGIFSQKQLMVLASHITDNSSKLLKQLGEESIVDKCSAVALECRIYLSLRPDLTQEDFNYDMEMRKIAVQTIGVTGYTALIEKPGTNDEPDNYIIWAHPDSALVGSNLFVAMKEALGPSFPQFSKMFEEARKGNTVSGYYTWRSNDGKVRDKFAALASVSDTPYLVLSTTFIDEFTGRVEAMQSTAKKLTVQTRNVTFGIFVGALLIIGLSILIYGYKISKNIKYLTDAADRISVGELDFEIKIDSKDEIGNLGAAISRMQDSLRLSIERLRKKK